MKHQLLLPLLLLVSSSLAARTLEVGAGRTYTTLEAAASVALPGDTILFRSGVHAGGESVSGLRGTAENWITIMVAPGEEAILRGGTNGWQLSDPAYLRIVGFVLEGQTGNGLNIDDAGTFDTPAHHLVIERCEWRGIDATGNNDQLKMSGVDSFEVRECLFRDGSPGGSMIDMVGCHDGAFLRNRFERGGSNAIQAKGGTREIRIEGNTFIEAGARAINIGGSTGLQFFRPPGILYESAFIRVYSNVFVGSQAPIAFVGTINSEVVNNTIWTPGKWAIRILQETTEPGFAECGDNIFRNNIVVVGNAAGATTLNIGSNTRPASFTFSNNLWYNTDNSGWNGPNLPVAETDGRVGANPTLAAPPGDMSLVPGSPAIAAGASVSSPSHDYLGNPFATPRSIGAIEGGGPTTSVAVDGARGSSLTIVRLPRETHATANWVLASAGTIDAAVYDLRGERIWSCVEGQPGGEGRIKIPVGEFSSGLYLCVVRSRDISLTQIFAVER